MPRKGSKTLESGQEVTRQVSGEVSGTFDSLVIVRSPSPVSASSCVNETNIDRKDVDLYRLRILDLEQQLLSARLEAQEAEKKCTQKGREHETSDYDTSDRSECN